MADSILARARPLLVARLAGALVAFAVPIVLARALVPASYGTFKQAWLLSHTLALVLPLGITPSLYYFVPREPAERTRFVAQTTWLLAGLGLLAAGLLLAGAPLVAAHFRNPELDRLLPWVAAFTGLQLAGAPLDVAWNASGRIGWGAAARALTEAGRAACMVAGALLAGLEGVFAGITLAHAIRAAVTLPLALPRGARRPDLALLRRQAAYALPFGLAFLAIVPQQQLHHYAVAAATTAAAYAVYSVGTFQLPVVDMVYTPVSEILQIGLAEADGRGEGPRAGLALFHEAVGQLAFAVFPMAAGLAVLAPSLVEAVFSRAYLEAVPIFRLSLVAVALAALPLDGVMRARAQNRFMLALSVVKLGATAALVPAGLAAAGPLGALCGFLVAEALARAAMLARTARLLEARLAEVLPWRALARFAALSAAGAAAAALGVAVPGAAAVKLAAGLGAFTAAYLGLAAAWGGVPAGWRAVLARRARAAPATPTSPVSTSS